MRIFKTFLARYFLVLAVVLAAVPLPYSAQAATVETRVTFVLICDIYNMGEKDGRGGLPRIAAVLKAEKARGRHVIIAHAGDAISPSLMSGIDRGEHMIELLNMLPIDIFVPGNHEFDFGPEVFAQRMVQARFPIYAANLTEADGKPLPAIQDASMIEADGVKIGLIGLTAEDSAKKSSPGNLKFSGSVRTLERLSRRLKRQGADLIVTVAHAGRAVDNQLLASGALDILLSGDDHDLALKYNGKTVMVEAMQEGLFVVAIDLDIEVTARKGKRRVKWWPRFRVIDTADFEPDKEVAARVALYEGQLSKELDVPIGRTETEMESSNAIVRGGEAALANLFTDAIREATGAQVAILNGGSFRGNRTYAPGSSITRRHILSELPFANKTFVMELTGAQLREVLEQGIARAESLTGAFPHVSGMKVRADISKAAGQRVARITIGGKPVDPDATYTVATNDFLARGGDGITGFAKGKTLIGASDAKLVANHVMSYIRRKRSVSPKLEGRVIVARGSAPR